MSCDPKFRNDVTYIFFLLLGKELIELKRCKNTFFRQATRLPTLNKDSLGDINLHDLSRFNRDYSVFKKLRGTAPYFEESKKQLMAHLRQNGCPTIFLTLSFAEFDWIELTKEVAETVYRRTFSWSDIEEMTTKEKNKLISDNVVQTTLHFSKRFQKLFSLMQCDFFGSGEMSYHVSSYVEFQQRGAPHLHAVLWLKDKNHDDAPAYWSREDDDLDNISAQIERFADLMISTSSTDIMCRKHRTSMEEKNLPTCNDCLKLKEKINKYQLHSHTATCEKKGKLLTIKANEGHGRLDGIIEDREIRNIRTCRFNFPQFPLDSTMLIVGVTKETDEDIVRERKADLIKILKFLIRQTSEEESLNKLIGLSFCEFLYSVGMFAKNKSLHEFNVEELNEAKSRYVNAISVSIQGTAKVFLKRSVSDIFINGYNEKIMSIFEANHDLQVVIDPYGAA